MKTERGISLSALAVLLGSLALAPGLASAALPACADLPGLPPLAGNPAVFSATAAELTTGGRAYCRVDVVWRDPKEVGSAAGYAPGSPPQADTFQHIRLGIALPLNTNTGDAAWGHRLIMTAGGGAQGSVPNITSMVGMTPAAMGAGSDSGHGDANSGSGDSWGVIQGVGLNRGKVEDWAGGGSNGVTVKLAKALAKTYYGTKVKRTYWNGCSGGGHMGWAQLMHYGDEYDGALIGAAANHWQKFRLADSWDEIVRKKLAQQTGGTFTSAQLAAANAAATAACDAADGVTDGIVADPRACTWSATNNVCGVAGAPAAPGCLTPEQAKAIDTMWDGPRNAKGKRIWHPYDRGLNLGTGTSTQGSTNQVLRWATFDNSFDGNNLYQDRESIELAAAAGVDVSKAITYEDAAELVSRRTADYVDDDEPKDLREAYNRGVKIISYHGLQDGAIHFRNSVDIYRRVAAHFGRGNEADFKRAQRWFRLFLTPGQGHCGNQYPGALDALVNWVENGDAPDSLERSPGVGVPLGCPFPQRAIYQGGDTADPASYVCGGDLDKNRVALCGMLRTKYKKETGSKLNYAEAGINKNECRTKGGKHDDDDDDD